MVGGKGRVGRRGGGGGRGEEGERARGGGEEGQEHSGKAQACGGGGGVRTPSTGPCSKIIKRQVLTP